MKVYTLLIESAKRQPGGHEYDFELDISGLAMSAMSPYPDSYSVAGELSFSKRPCPGSWILMRKWLVNGYCGGAYWLSNSVVSCSLPQAFVGSLPTFSRLP